MRGEDAKQQAMFSYVSPERRVPPDHHLRTMVTQADGTAERDVALLMASKIPGTQAVTLGGDKNYDTRDFVETVREMRITPHVAQNTTNRPSAIDGRTTRHLGYEISRQKRKRVEQSFGWMKMIGLLRKVKLRGIRKVSWWFTFVGAAYNLLRAEARARDWKQKTVLRHALAGLPQHGPTLPHRLIVTILTGME